MNFIETYDKLSYLVEDNQLNNAPIIAFLLPAGKYGFLSNWYPSIINIYDQQFTSGEQAFMYAKADMFLDDEIKQQILQVDDPKKLKALGRKIRGFDEVMWATARVDLMTEIVTAKFTQNADLLQKLLDTGNAILVEANNYDKFWGCGLRATDAQIKDVTKWPGQNMLGKILMTIRAAHQPTLTENITLQEGKAVGPVSYGVKGSVDGQSSVKVLSNILNTNQIKASAVQADLYPGSEKDAFVSTSRDLLSHIKGNAQRPVGLVLDGDKLSNKYKINPINWATLELNKDTSRLNLKGLIEYTNAEDETDKLYKVQFDCYGSFFISKKIFDILEQIMISYNATETVNRKGETTTLGATRGFVSANRVGSQGKKLPKPGKWIITKGYFYSVINGGGVNISKGSFDKYRADRIGTPLDISSDEFISELIHNHVLDETEERIIQQAVLKLIPNAQGKIRKNARTEQEDSYFDIKDCIMLILLPIKYKRCWDSDGTDVTYEQPLAKLNPEGKPYTTSKLLSDAETLAKDIPELKQTIIAQGLQDRVFWVEKNTTNAQVRRAL
jgi:ribA/ribD-fused uncharacterized protein